MNSKKCKSVFQDEQFANKNYKLRIAKTKNKKTARCTLCQKEIDLLTMGNVALDSHAFSKKQTTKMIDLIVSKDQMKFFFKKQESISERVTVSESSASWESSKKSLPASNKIDSEFAWAQISYSKLSLQTVRQPNSLNLPE